VFQIVVGGMGPKTCFGLSFLRVSGCYFNELVTSVRNIWLTGGVLEVGCCDGDTPTLDKLRNNSSILHTDDPDHNLAIGGHDDGEMVPIPTTVA